jgi:UDP-glucuronate 4-epimerase
MNNKERILVTGCAGFIGMHISRKLLIDGYTVLGLDNINNYYDQKLKKDRLKILQSFSEFSFEKIDITNQNKLSNIFQKFKPLKVINLAAQAGVRYSLKKPEAYISSNISGFMNILECCRYNNIRRLVYASSSSVYGSNRNIPFSPDSRVNKPISIYAVSKRANELMAYSYSHLYNISTIGLRFFTVYGPWGRPDMVFSIFADGIINKKVIKVYNKGDMYRDFTYIDDIVDGIILSLSFKKKYSIFNLGSNKKTYLINLIQMIESGVGEKAKRDLTGMQQGDVKNTLADIESSKKLLGYSPKINLKSGLIHFLNWYKDYYG